MRRLTKNGAPLTPSRRAPRPPRLALSDLMVLAATHRVKVEPKAELGRDFNYPWPLAHAASPEPKPVEQFTAADWGALNRCREHVGDGGGMGGCLESCVKCGVPL